MKFLNTKNKYKSIYNITENNQYEILEKDSDILKLKSFPNFQKKDIEIYNSNWESHPTIANEGLKVTQKDNLLPTYVTYTVQSPELDISDLFIPFVDIQLESKVPTNVIITPLAEYKTSIWATGYSLIGDGNLLAENKGEGLIIYDTDNTVPIQQAITMFLYSPEIDTFATSMEYDELYWKLNTGSYPTKLYSGLQIQYSSNQNITFWKVKSDKYILKFNTKLYFLQRAEIPSIRTFDIHNDVWKRDNDDPPYYPHHRIKMHHTTTTRFEYYTKSTDIQLKFKIIIKNPKEFTKSIYINDKI